MANIIENIADRVTSSLGAKVNFGEKVTLEQGEAMPVSLVWFGFGGGGSDSIEGDATDGESGSGGGGGGASIPLGVYVGATLGPRFVPNLIPLLAVSIPLVCVTGRALSLVIPALRKWRGRQPRNDLSSTAVARAAVAASAPLSSFDPGRPARSMPCCSSSRVSTPNPTGLPVSSATRVRPSVAAFDTKSKCGVPPRMMTPRATTASAPFSKAALQTTGSSKLPGTRTSVTWAPDASSTRRAP